ncbi:MAG: FHA domain-containing protein [Planctomycetes bacterium]|nr:FHA domain-containing protein [Planctomycetota bacterium]
MTFVTLKVLEGMDRGVVYSQLPLPVTIGRESDSDVRVDDDRASRAHAKLQEHGGQVILTDIDSTNGTRVNGHPIQMRVMQHGDVILIGRCSLLFQLCSSTEPVTDCEDPRMTVQDPFEDLSEGNIGEEPGELFPLGRPAIPGDLTMLQRVQLSDLLSYVHEQLGIVVKGAVEDLHGSKSRSIKCDAATWNRLTALQASLAEDLNLINNPAE